MEKEKKTTRKAERTRRKMGRREEKAEVNMISFFFNLMEEELIIASTFFSLFAKTICMTESSCGRGGDGPVALNIQRQSLGFLFWMVKCSFTLYLLISHGMKAGGSVYSFIHSLKANAQEGTGRLRKAPEMNIKYRQSILTYSHDNGISYDIVVHMYISRDV